LERDIGPLWHEPYGDRQQEIVVIGQNLNQEAICRAFNECLVSDDSMKVGQEVWNKTVQESGDPFQETWDEAIVLAQKEGNGTHDHHHDHDHHNEKNEPNANGGMNTCSQEDHTHCHEHHLGSCSHQQTSVEHLDTGICMDIAVH
jgi:G3E family GTPase